MDHGYYESRRVAVIGTRSGVPVVWGLGTDEQSALADARRAMSETDHASDLRAVRITDAQYERCVCGEGCPVETRMVFVARCGNR